MLQDSVEVGDVFVDLVVVVRVTTLIIVTIHTNIRIIIIFTILPRVIHNLSLWLLRRALYLGLLSALTVRRTAIKRVLTNVPIRTLKSLKDVLMIWSLPSLQMILLLLASPIALNRPLSIAIKNHNHLHLLERDPTPKKRS